MMSRPVSGTHEQLPAQREGQRMSAVQTAPGSGSLFEYVPAARGGLGVQWRLFFLQAVVIGLLTVLLAVVQTVELRDYTAQEFGQRALMGSRTVAVMPSVVRALETGTRDPQINILANAIRRRVGAGFIVIADRKGVRWSHPNPAQVGHLLTESGKSGANNEPPNEDTAPMHGIEQISTSQGSLGTSIRAKVSVFGANGQVIGLVSTGYLLPTVLSSAGKVTATLWPWLGIGLTLALACSMWVSRKIRRELLDLEPVQIAALVQQHRAVLNALHEGVLVIAADGTLSAANPLAARLLGLTRTAQPLPIAQLWPALAALQFSEGARGNTDILLPLNSTPVMVSSMPCGAGRVVTFRDRAEVTRVAEELTHSRELTDLLRAQSHEFMNRLHTIAGLIHLKRSQEALELISAQTEQTSNVQELLSAVEVPAVAALIIGKFARAHEKRVQLIVEPGSALGAAWEDIASDVLVPVLGNLLENAFEAAQEGRPAGEGQVRLMLGEDPQGLELEVRDNGLGVPDSVLARRFGERLSSHGPQRGYGLPLIERTLAALGGNLTHLRRGEQTIFRVHLPFPGGPVFRGRR